MTRPAVEVLRDAGATVGEGPCWDAARGALVWVDILSSVVHLEQDGRTRSLPTPEHVGAALPTRDGRLLLAMGLSLAILDPDTGTVVRVARVDGDPADLRFNDAEVDPSGRLWAGTMAYDERPGAGALFRLDPDGVPRRVLDGLGIANGLAFTPAGDRVFFIDSPTRTVAVHDVDPASGDLGPGRVAVDTRAHPGVPDGMAMDAEGHLWVAFFGGGAVRRFSQDGALLDTIELPAANITSCCFGARGLDVLHITSARQGLSAAELEAQPHAGALFAVRPGVTGRPSTPAVVPGT